jgi:predicted nucleic acid-binding protein
VVLLRPKLCFAEHKVERLLAEIRIRGLSVTVRPSDFPMPDESDRKFYDIAKACDASLITGNKKHYPTEPFIITPSAFCETINDGSWETRI